MEGPTKEQIEESVRFTNWMEGVRKYTLEQVERRKQIEKSKVGNSDAVNPMHYRVAGIPEAIEIMEHLMTKEQLEGFLWGGISSSMRIDTDAKAIRKKRQERLRGMQRSWRSQKNDN